jgi:sec-independent protein translocase protein TatB
MLDIGFFELLVIAVVLMVVMGPERLPEVARQVAFYIRKARQGMYRLRNEMQSEIEGTPFADLEKAKQEMADLKNDMRQFGRDLADSVETKLDTASPDPEVEMTGEPVMADAAEKSVVADPDSK